MNEDISLIKTITPPKFNIASEKWWLEDYFPIGKVTFQGRTVKLRSGYKVDFPACHVHFIYMGRKIQRGISWRMIDPGVKYESWKTMWFFWCHFVGNHYSTLSTHWFCLFSGGGWKNAFEISSKSTWCPGPFPFYHSLKFGLTLDPGCQSLPGFLFTSLGSGIPGRTFFCHCY